MLIEKTISELDIKHAAPSIWFSLNVITKKEYEYLISLDKHTRVVKTGLLIKDRPELYPVLNEGYKVFANMLLEANNINESSILMKSHDAIWLLDVIPEKTKFKEVEYVLKSCYDIMYRYKKCEFFFSLKEFKLRTRGVSSNIANECEELLVLITDCMVLFMNKMDNDIYFLLHRAKKKLLSDPLCYGPNITGDKNKLGNIGIINNMIKNFL